MLKIFILGLFMSLGISLTVAARTTRVVTSTQYEVTESIDEKTIYTLKQIDNRLAEINSQITALTAEKTQFQGLKTEMINAGIQSE